MVNATNTESEHLEKTTHFDNHNGSV